MSILDGKVMNIHDYLQVEAINIVRNKDGGDLKFINSRPCTVEDYNKSFNDQMDGIAKQLFIPEDAICLDDLSHIELYGK